jgi:YD repeat-containing protein
MNCGAHVHFRLHVLAALVFIPCASAVSRATTVATPTFSPAAGSYTGTQSVTISDTTSGATIYYTTNGTTPSSSSTRYTAAVSVSTSETIKAIADKSGDTNSAVASATYTITVSTPTFSPAAGGYIGTQSVTISDATSGSTIYYTTNGTAPTSSSTQYTGAISVSTSETVKAIAELTGATNSAVASAAYTITVSTPTFSPVGGTYTNNQSVTISDVTSSATCYYTLTAGTTGTTPTTSSAQYSSAISVTATSVLESLCAFSGDTNSAVGSAAYTMQVVTPTFSPAAGTYSNNQSLTISDTTTGANIYYTTNGTTPTTSSSQYTSPITVSSTETVKAIAAKTGYTNSSVGSAAYTMQVATPTFSPGAGTYTSIQTVTISDTTTGATIYYTTNGSTPTTSSTQYTGAITVSSTETVKALATLTGYTNSSVGSAAYTINLTTATPTFSPGAGTYTSPQTVTISDSTSGAKIYYTTNGSTPTTSSTRYSSPITVSATETVKAIATATGYAQSAVGSAAYTINLIVANPTFSPAGGTYSDALAVSINDATAGPTIYYTTDGSTPTTSSPVYTGAITISSTKTIKALGTESGYAQSSVVSATYTLPAQASTLTTLSMISGGNPVSTVTPGSVVTLKASVTSGGLPLTTGTVNFCDANATYCVDIHIVGTAQLTSAGSASITFVPSGGVHNYKAALVGSLSYLTSASGSSALTVGPTPTTTTLSTTGGAYPLTAAISEPSTLYAPPTGTVSFVDTSNSNSQLGTAAVCNGYPQSPECNSGAVSQTLIFNSLSSITFPLTAFLDNDLVATGDFNGDGKADMAVFSGGSGTGNGSVSVYLSNGDGTFALASGSPITINNFDPYGAVTGDFNDDGKLDLAVIDTNGNLAMLLGNGNGTFALRSPVFMDCYGPVSVVVADFNRDGKLDLAVPCGNTVPNNTWGIIVLLGGGDGTFSPAFGTPILFNDGSIQAAVAGDFNGDGIPDLATTSAGQASILLGNGDGTFTEASGSPITVGNENMAIATADFNGDGKADLVVGDFYYGQVDVLWGNGDGTFHSGPKWSVGGGGGANAIVVADFNMDGAPDLAVANQYYGTVSYLSPSAAQTICGMSSCKVNANTGSPDYEGSWNLNGPYSVAAGDFNGDGVPDLAAVIYGSNSTQSTIDIFGTGLTQTMIAPFSGPSPTGGGIQNVEAVYAGDTNYATSTSGTTPLGVPWISNIAPASGLPLAIATIFGTNFGSSSNAGGVTFNGTPATVMGWTPNSIQALVPVGATTGPVVVTYGTNVSNSIPFVVPNNAQITAVNPPSAPVGTNVTISGIGFGTSGTVTFNGVTASPTSWGLETIIVPVPAGATSGLIVVNDGVTSHNFTVSPGISAMTPAQGTAGTAVTITGTTFGATQGASAVLFNGIPATISSWSDSSIVAHAPGGTSTGNVAVVVNGATGAGPVFTFLPSITSISPTTGPVGAAVTITGASFGFPQGISSVRFGQIAAIPIQWSENSIVATVPTGAVTGSVSVNVGGQSSNGVTFTVGTSQQNGLGTISGTVTQSDGVTPIAGASVSALLGSSVMGSALTNASGAFSLSNLTAGTYSVQGSGFGFGAVQESNVSVVANQTTMENLSLSGQSSISYSYDALGRLVAASDPVNGAATYNYDPVGNILSIGRSNSGQEAILNFMPPSGTVGSTVTISGSSFSANSSQDSVSFAGTQAAVTSASTNQLVVTVPSGAASGPISVTAPSGTATSGISFTVTTAPPGPTIASFSPSMGNIGVGVTISGNGFDVMTNDQVEFGGIPALVNTATPTSISATVPANAVTGPISVTTPSGVATSSADFFVIPAGYGPSQVDFTEQMTIGGAPYTGTIINGGDVGIVVFNASSGQQFSLNVNASTIASAIVSVWSPNGVEIASGTIGVGSTILDNLTASMAGSYMVLAASAGSSDTGNLTFNLSQGSSGASGSGTTSTGQISISVPGQSASAYFEGTAGQLAGVLLTNSTFPDCGTLWILNPDGSTLISRVFCDTAYFLGPTALPSTGTYTVLFTTDTAGTAKMAISLFMNQVIPLTPPYPGTIGTQFSINIPGQSGELTFSGTSGESASVQLTGSTFPGCNALYLAILNPDGSTLISGSMCGTGNWGIGPTTLPSNGMYTVLLYPYNGAGTTGISLTLQ